MHLGTLTTLWSKCIQPPNCSEVWWRMNTLWLAPFACVGVFSEPLCRLPIKAAQLVLSFAHLETCSVRTWNFAAAVTKSLAADRKVKAENQGVCNKAGALRPVLSDLGQTSPRLSPEVASGLRAVSL